jgi:tetratricopeptide (TPR) repeat protein
MRKAFALLWFFCALTGYAQTRAEQEAFKYYMSGVKYYNIRKYDMAITDFTEAIRLNSKDADYYYWRGHTYLDRAYPHKLAGNAYWQDDWKRGIADFEAALRLDPNHTDARENLVYAKEAASNQFAHPPEPIYQYDEDEDEDVPPPPGW